MLRVALCLFVLSLAGFAQGADDGLALTPPMGWRSWNCYGADVDQPKMESIMDKMTQRIRSVDGVPTSLADLGYIDCGLDDNWQACGAGVDNSFHDADGNPLINKDRFPDMKAMTDYGHSKGLKVGFYMNNCICSENQFKDADYIAKHMEAEAKAVVGYGYDAVKLDGCGQFRNLTWWHGLLNATGKAVVIENCHWGQTVPGDTSGDAPCSGTTEISDCPYHFYRTSGDITNTWASMYSNLQTTIKFQGDVPLSRPGAWAYPDMLEVGRMPTYEMDRTHFGAWVITSSPLVLGYDLNNEALTDAVWDIISNREAIAINQQWAGHPGRMVRTWNPAGANVTSKFAQALSCSAGDARQHNWSFNSASGTVMNGEFCLDFSDPSELTLRPCTGAAVQQFRYENKSLIASNGQCVDVYDYQGPVVQLYACHGGANQNFDFNADSTLTDNDSPKFCVTITEESPAGSAGMQLWTKKQPEGKLAAFVLNAFSYGAWSATLDFAELGFTSSAVHVRDVWSRQDVGVFQGNYTTPAIVPYDSQLLLLTPVN